jgi:SAM-dependent methyltransferase
MGWGLPPSLRWLPSPTLVPIDHIQRTLAQVGPAASILDVGAGGRRIRPDVVTVDAFAAPGVDIVGDIHALPIDDAKYDCVICTGTLEHVQDPWQAVRELRRVLKPGGIVHIDVPFMQGFHADPNDYWRFTKEGLRLLCRDFEELDCGVHIGPTCGMVWVIREWADSLTSNRYISNMLLAVAAVLTAPLKYLDYLAIKSSRSHRVASAVFFRGRKSGPAAAPATL